MATTPVFDMPLPEDGQTPWGDDYRDALVEIDSRLLSVRGSLFVEDNTDATPSPGSAGAKAVLNGVQSGPFCRFCTINGNRITYTGPLPKVPTVIATVNLQSGANTTLQVQIRRNGELVDGASKKCRLPSGVPAGFITAAANIPLEPGDYLELWVANLTGAQDITVTDATLLTRG